MATNTADVEIALVMLLEGGFVDNANDPGGVTYRGISQAAYPKLNIRALAERHDEATVAALYRSDYWDRLRCDDLPAGVDLAVFDDGVLSGQTTAGRDLQRAVGASLDGVIGPRTLRRVAYMEPGEIIGALSRQRIARARACARRQPEELGGWLGRIEKVTRRALSISERAAET